MVDCLVYKINNRHRKGDLIVRVFPFHKKKIKCDKIGVIEFDPKLSEKDITVLSLIKSETSGIPEIIYGKKQKTHTTQD